MLSIGGVIGAGLFVGSSAVIAQAGPLAFVTYAITGSIVFLVMRMLGEMAATRPCTGSFAEYARMAWGEWAGFATGWVYWYAWVIVVGFEAVVGGQIINGWWPAVPVWLIALALLVLMTVVNLFSVGSFGEAEYWFAGIKIVAIVAFLVVTTLFVLGLWPGASVNFANLTQHGGLLPNGLPTLFVGVVVVIFSMTGVELATIAAAESKNPANAVRRAINSSMLRILMFFVASTFLIVVVVPWNAIMPGESPFVAALDRIGISWAGQVLTLVILVAVLSVLNSGMYTASRLLFAMAERGDAPAWIRSVNSRGVPVTGILACTVVGYGSVLLAAFFPDTVFLFLINTVGTIWLLVYVMICLSQLRLRRRWERESPESLRYRMWCYPALPTLVTLSLIVVLVAMAFRPENRVELAQGISVWIVLSVVYLVKTRFARKSDVMSSGDEVGGSTVPVEVRR